MTIGYQPDFIGKSLNIPMPRIADEQLLKVSVVRVFRRAKAFM